MSTSSVNGLESFKKVQFDFVSWAANWLKNDIQIEPASFDLPDIVNLLQAVGFKIRHIDATKEPTLLRGGEHGSRVVITCTHSGQRCVMEEPLLKAQCKCTKSVIEDDATKDGFWEVTASTPGSRQSLIETGCDLIPPLSRDHSSLIKTVLSYFLKLVREKKPAGSLNNLMATPVRTGRRSEPVPSSNTVHSPLHRSSLGTVGIAVRPEVALTPKKGLDSPARYRSLDTLTAKDADIGLPEPGNLIPKICVQRPGTQSSPSLRMRLEVQESASSLTSSEINLKATNLIKNASETLLKAIAMIESEKRPSSPSSVFEEKMMSASKNIKKLICTSKPSSKSESVLADMDVAVAPKTKRRIAIRSTDSYTLSVKPVAVKTGRPKLSSIGGSIPKPEGVVRRPEKFSHIKSTIPKCEPKRK